MGRPRIHTPELAATICERIASGESLREICEPDTMPSRETVRRWILHNDGAIEGEQDSGFSGQYARAKAASAEAFEDRIMANCSALESDRLTMPQATGRKSAAELLFKLAAIRAPKTHRDLTKLEHFIGPPLLQAFMQFYGFDEAKAWEAVNFYRERFKVTGLYENHVFDGVMPLLEDLNGQGRQLYVATSKPWVFAREIARHFDFAKHFKVIYGSELDGTRTNKVELIAHLMAEEGLDPATTLMIGDRKHDLIGARSNGVDAAAVGYGFGSYEELNAEAPTWHFETLAEMHQAFVANYTS